MSVFRLLIVEDNEVDLSTCRDCVTRYKDEKKRVVELVECRSFDSADQALKNDNSFDGAIIDLKLGAHGDEGNQVKRKIVESLYRIPVAIFTGTPDNAENTDHIGVFKKGETSYEELFDRFWGIHSTGLTRIMGGRGIIEMTLSEVFRKNLLPQKDQWVEYGEVNASKTEKALLRHTLSHLLQLLDDDQGSFYPEEVYLFPPLSKHICTGSIVKNKQADQRFVVMNPACDLVIREGGKFKTDRILVVEIDLQDVLFPSFPNTGLSKAQNSELTKAFKNNNAPYYHWLPKTKFFEGGFMNFRKLLTLNPEQFSEQFEIPDLQVSPAFVKDMVARFSAYYARQGQPDIDFEKILPSSTCPIENMH